jgi:hypothetical protein
VESNVPILKLSSRSSGGADILSALVGFHDEVGGSKAAIDVTTIDVSVDGSSAEIPVIGAFLLHVTAS